MNYQCLLANWLFIFHPLTVQNSSHLHTQSKSLAMYPFPWLCGGWLKVKILQCILLYDYVVADFKLEMLQFDFTWSRSVSFCMTFQWMTLNSRLGSPSLLNMEWAKSRWLFSWTYSLVGWFDSLHGQTISLIVLGTNLIWLLVVTYTVTV